jgi:hypothetical protein
MKIRVVLLASAIVGLTGCNGWNAPAADNPPAAPAPPAVRTIVAADGSCQVALPLAWVERRPEKNRVLWACVEPNGPMFHVIPTPREDLADDMTLVSFADGYFDTLRQSPRVDQVTVTKGPALFQVNGLAAVRYEVDGVVRASRYKVRWHFAFVVGRRAFYMLTAALRPSDEAAHRAAIDAALASFAEGR